MTDTPFIITHCGQLGDFVYTWPICSWLQKRSGGRRIHFVLPKCFGPFNHVESLLRLQSFTAGVTLVDYQVQNYGHGGQPYRFNPFPFLAGTDNPDLQAAARTGEYYNFGFRGFPDSFIPKYVGEEHQFGWDADWKLELAMSYPSFNPPDYAQRAGQPCYTEHANFNPPAHERMDMTKDVLFNARRMALASESHCFFSSMAVIMYFARKHFFLYRQPGHASEDLYFPDRSRYELRKLSA